MMKQRRGQINTMMKQRWGQKRVGVRFWTFSSSFWRPTTEGSQTEPLYFKTGRTNPLYAASFTSCGISVKISISLSANIADMQIICDSDPNILDAFDIFEDRSIQSMDLFDPFPCYLHHIALTGWNLIPNFLAQHPSWSISFWSFNVSSVSLIFR